MKRILACTASDFGQASTPKEIKQAIRSSEGRTILAEIAAFENAMFSEITHGELAAAFGADLVLIKHMDYALCTLSGVEYENPVAALRELSGIGIGLNLEIADDEPLNKNLSTSTLEKAISLNPDFLSITGYRKPEVTHDRILASIQLVREQYQDFLMVHPVAGHFTDLNIEHLLSYVKAGADMITLPAPGAIAGVTEEKLSEIINTLRAEGTLVSLTTSTSQEGTDERTARDIALASKRAGADVYAFGDAGISGMADPMNIFATSLAVRGKRHTYIRMARSAKR